MRRCATGHNSAVRELPSREARAESQLTAAACSTLKIVLRCTIRAAERLARAANPPQYKSMALVQRKGHVAAESD